VSQSSQSISEYPSERKVLNLTSNQFMFAIKAFRKAFVFHLRNNRKKKLTYQRIQD